MAEALSEREEQLQRAFSQELRRPKFSFDPQLNIADRFATYGGDARAEIPLGKNTSLNVTAGGTAGRGFGSNKGARMPFAPRGGIEFEYKF